MNELVAILSHADTPDKVSVLEECVNEIKKQGKKIIISSHINIPEHLYDIADYVIYDKENPIIRYDEYQSNQSVVFVWASYLEYFQNFPIEFNHAYAVHRLILNCLSIAKSNDYDIIHFVNYDYVIKDEKILENHNLLLKDYDIVSYMGFENQEHISSAFFSIKNNDVIYNSLLNVKSKEDYCRVGVPIYEEFLYKILNEHVSTKYIHIDEIKNSGNVIGSKSILNDFMTDLEDKTTLSIFRSKQNDSEYLFISNNISREVYINGRLFNTRPNVTLFLINDELLDNSIEVEFRDLNIKRVINKKTQIANADVKDPSIIDYSLIDKKYTIDKYINTTTTRWEIINYLSDVYKLSDYLEIGVNDGICIRNVTMTNKDGVDPNPGSELGINTLISEVNYVMTSDDFFENHVSKKYDLIFVDGLHHSEQVDKDIKNSLSNLKEGGFIIVHDCNPPEYESQLIPRVTGIWNGDVWKSILKLRCTDPSLEISVVDTDWGVGVIRKGSSDIYTKEPLEKCLEWNYFDLNRESLLNIISVDDFYKKYKPSVELVIAAYDRDYDWTSQLKDTKLTVYNKNIKTLKDVEILLDNVGRDVHTFFKHIVDNYDNLSDFTYFVQDYPFDHVSNVVDLLNNEISLDDYSAYKADGCWFFNNTIQWPWGGGYVYKCDKTGHPHAQNLNIENIWKRLFNNPLPDEILFVPGGHFCIKKEKAKKIPLEFYKKILDILENDDTSPWVIERLELYIFNII